ncbi:MAG: 3-deoxy-manno-octulosonate cytidylyltransferase [Rhodobacteraceae bacterium]|nr:3-deoxy-manno-octulosonate cytidylyltransferase [Paracoccaceae bacterium]
MPTLMVIPARYGSTRFPGKPLADLRGASGRAKPLVQRVWEAALLVGGVDRIVVATDDERIRQLVESFGGEAAMTSRRCRNGTERCAEAAEILGFADGVVVNLQGDAPLTPPSFIEALHKAMARGVQVATPVLGCDGRMLRELREERRRGAVGGTTVVADNSGKALYFSKEVIPWCGEEFEDDEPTPALFHVGVYAYTVEALNAYRNADPGTLETAEGLEQLRFLETGTSIQCVPVSSEGRLIWEVNNPQDVAIVERGLKIAGLV